MTLCPLRLEVAELDSSPLPLDLAVVKEHLAVDGDDNDALIEQLVLASIRWGENYMRRTIFARTHTWVLREFPADAYGEIRLPRGKTQSIEGIAYSVNGQIVTLAGPSSGSPAGTDYQEDLRGNGGAIVMPARSQSWPSTDLDVPAPVVITFTAGWLPNEVPADVIHGLLFSVSDAFDLRGTGDFTTFGSNFTTREGLLSPYRLKRWF